MKRYNPAEIEPKWQKTWEEQGIYHATEDPAKPKRYVLEYFPYPSGAAMHVGHVRNYTIGDAVSRYWRMQGHNVLHPMGWDAFGLPAENYAIKTNISPQQAVAQNVERFKKQLMQMGFGYDWSREINSTDPAYYKWTQSLFKLLFDRGLAYQKESLQWWCETDKTVLANEQVENGKCWRCGNQVVKKPLKQWFFKITDYADRLADDLDKLDWSDAIKTMQRNWIGRSEGASVAFKLEGLGSDNEQIEVFTTAHDTIYGVTFMVFAPEHPLIAKYAPKADNWDELKSYISSTAQKSELDREIEKKKTGVEVKGLFAVNPVNNLKVPVWIADYVLLGYGTGAVMAVPGEDERDFEFAQKFNLPVIYTTEQQEFINYQTEIKQSRKKFTLASSEEFNGLDFETGRAKILEKLVESGAGKAVTQYKIRDWLISRQRYWGAPIPIVHCPADGAVAIPEDQLPVVLPEVTDYQPSGDGRSPLAKVKDWVETTCPKCGGPAQRETDTMDGFACSSWYFLRFADPHNDQKAFDDDKAKFWLPVDDYIGGAEHAVMHLLYARFWTKVMHDAGLIEFDEPFSSLRNHGMILAPDGRKMSKSWGNTIEPDGLISKGYGADAIRIMELFIGPWNQSANWSTEGLGGCYRFLQRSWNISQDYFTSENSDANDAAEKKLQQITHRTIKKVTEDLRDMGFNTAIAVLMEFVNDLYKIKAEHSVSKVAPWKEAITALAQLLAPFAPHIAEELWQQLGNDGSVHVSEWPKWDDSLVKTDTVSVAVQINGRVRGEVAVAPDADEVTVKTAALSQENVQQHVQGKETVKVIYVPGRIINIVVK